MKRVCADNITTIGKPRVGSPLIQYTPLFPHAFKLYSQRLLSPHPMVLIVRPSPKIIPIRHLRVYLIGYLQLLWLVGFSFIFSTTVNGTLFRTLLLVTSLVSLVALSRFISIYHCWWLEKKLNVTLIEYDTEEEHALLDALVIRLRQGLVESQLATSSCYGEVLFMLLLSSSYIISLHLKGVLNHLIYYSLQYGGMLRRGG